MSYTAKAATTGHSRGFRVESRLFEDHQEFRQGEYEVNVLAPGCLLVRSKVAPVAEDDPRVDPVMSALIRYTEHEMAKHPERIAALTARSWQEALDLVQGVDVDLTNDQLDQDFELP